MGGGVTISREPSTGSPSTSEETIVGSEVELEPGASIGDYVITGELGRGGMGVVYAARHPTIGKEVAIKVVHRSLSQEPSVKQRVLQEARILTEVRNAHIVDIYSFGELADGRYYLVMELVEGQSLAGQLLHGPFDPLEAVSILLQIADALNACHASGVVHRDLKPDNIFLRREGATVDATLLDFGIAKVEGLEVDRGLTARGMILGTPEYMSPEQARADEIDERSDLYSLGILAFEILTGQPPFSGSTVIETLHAILNDTPSSVCDRRPELPIEMGELVADLMEKNPDARPSCPEVSVRLQSIRSLLIEQPLTSHRLPPKLERRRTTAGAHTAAGAASLVEPSPVSAPPRRAFARPRPLVISVLIAAVFLVFWIMSTAGEVPVADATMPAGGQEAARLENAASINAGTEVSSGRAPSAATDESDNVKKTAPSDDNAPKASRRARARARYHSDRSHAAPPKPATSNRSKRLAPDGLLDPFGKKKR